MKKVIAAGRAAALALLVALVAFWGAGEQESAEAQSFPQPTLKWHWVPPAGDTYKDWNQVMMAPVVADLDGVGPPEIVFTTFTDWEHLPNRGNYGGDGIIRVIRGDTGAPIYSITGAAHRVIPGAQIAVADINPPSNPDIIAIWDDPEGDCNRLIAFDGPTGTAVGFDTECIPFTYGGPTVADLEQDGTPEIVVGNMVWRYDAGLSDRFDFITTLGTSTGGYLSCVAHLHTLAHNDVIAGNGAWHYFDGRYWRNPNVPDGYCAVADFDQPADGTPEVVVVGDGVVCLLEHNGATIWCTVPPGSGVGGPPCVADFDGDGYPEIGVANANRFAVFEGADGSEMWRAPQHISDPSSQSASCSAFDFDGDGAYEIAYRDEDRFYMFDGRTGAVLFQTEIWALNSEFSYECPSGTLHEMPVIADVDKDGSADVVVPCNNYGKVAHGHFGATGIKVYGNPDWKWCPPIWNQHTYHITNINPDLSVPLIEDNNWEPIWPYLFYNNYRAQPPPPVPQVGGLLELAVDGSSSSAPPYALLAGATAAAAVVIAAGGWYARRRWLR